MSAPRHSFARRVNSALIGIAPMLAAAALSRWLPVGYIMEPGPRFLYWAAICGVNWLALVPLAGGIIQMTSRMPLRRMTMLALLGVVTSGALLFQYLGIVAVLRDIGPLPAIADIATYAAAAGFGTVLVLTILLHRPFRPPIPRQTAVPAELRMPVRLQGPPPGHNAPAEPGEDPLAEILAQSTPLAVRRRRRTLRLIWSDGETALKLRFEQALPQLGSLPGARVHRDWWVHRDGVADVRRRGRRIRLVLYDGREVPVDSAYEPQLTAQGWNELSR